MKSFNKISITVETVVPVPVDKAWKYWTLPEHITRWYQASDDWHAPYAENDLRVDGKFKTTMKAKDESAGFDFEGVYTKVHNQHSLAFTLLDGRKVEIFFLSYGDRTRIVETFETEEFNSHELQRTGWQAILESFKKYAESAWKAETLHYATKIKASPQKVYTLMIDQNHYQEWAAVFSPGSRYAGNWEKCSRILFLGEGKDGKAQGMMSRIRENIPFRFISIEHLGMIRDGEEVLTGKEVEDWHGATENYTFEETDEGTLLSVDLDAKEEYRDFFSETWPRALEILKHICENRDQHLKSSAYE